MFSKRYFPERLELDSFTTNTATSYNLFLLTYHKQLSELQSTMCFFFLHLEHLGFKGPTNLQ